MSDFVFWENNVLVYKRIMGFRNPIDIMRNLRKAP